MAVRGLKAERARGGGAAALALLMLTGCAGATGGPGAGPVAGPPSGPLAATLEGSELRIVPGDGRLCALRVPESLHWRLAPGPACPWVLAAEAVLGPQVVPDPAAAPLGGAGLPARVRITTAAGDHHFVR